MSNQRKIGAVLSYVYIIINSIVQLLYTPFLISCVGQTEYGLYSLISSILGYLTVLDLGFGNAIVVYTAKYRAQKKFDEEKKLHGMFLIIFCIIGLVATILGLILFFNVDSIFSTTMTATELSKAKIMMLILTFNLAITFPFSIYSSIINAYEKFVFRRILAICSVVLKPLLTIPLLLIGFKSISMSLVVTIVNVIVLVSNYLYCRNKLDIKIKFLGFDKKLFKVIFGYSFFIFLGTIADKVNWNVDQFILGAICGTVAVSVYSVAAQLNNMFVSLSTAISTVLLPKMSKMVAQNISSEELTDELIKVGRVQNYIIFLMITGFIILGREFINVWMGKGFEDVYIVSLLLIVPLCFELVQSLGLSIMQAMNKYKFRTIAMVIASIFNIVISIFMAKTYGVVGAAVGTALSVLVVNVFIINLYYHFSLKLNMIKFWKNIFLMIIPFLIPISAIIFIINLTKLTGLIYILIYGFIYVCLYSLVAYFLVMNDYEKNLVNSVLRKLHLIK